jgi:carboxyl-terminal processing protease
VRIRHLLAFALALPLALGAFHLTSTHVGIRGDAVASTEGFFGRGMFAAVGDLALGTDHQLSDLEIFERDLYWVKQRYVDERSLDPEAMFQAGLDHVERAVDEVMFIREPGGRRLQVSVGAHSTVIMLQPVTSFTALHGQLQRVATVLDAHLSADVDRPMVEYAFVNGALSTLDPHSMLLPPVSAKEMDVDNQGEFGGLGIEITVREGRLTVKAPLEGTPASRAGLKAGDHIIRIEDESTINMDLSDAVSRLRGKVGSPVRIKVKRKTAPTPLPFTIVRDVIRINPVEGQLLEGNVGYVRVKSFHGRTSADLEVLLTRFRREAGGAMQGLILDLRSNPGGYLHQAVEVSDRFLQDGVIVATIEGAEQRREEERASRAGTEPDYPIAVLVNGSSASASEIVAGALRNQNRAVIIGERTFGKGSIQHLYNNRDESKLKLTVGKYLTPGDHSIQSVGISPDILVQPSVLRAAETEGDPPVASLYYREWLEREEDLDKNLGSNKESFGAEAAGDPALSVRYLRPELDDDAEWDPRQDWEVGFAREVLLAADGHRRAEVLLSAQDVVVRRGAQEEASIVEAFAGLGIDWRAGQAPLAPTEVQLDVRLELSNGERLIPGEDGEVRLFVTNTGSAPVEQLSALTISENAWLDHREFYFGHLGPGETRSFPQKVSLNEGYGATKNPVQIRFRTPEQPSLLEVEQMVQSSARGLPRFAYALALHDDGSGTSQGNGDGRPDVGEIVDLELTVTNIGDGETVEAFARVKNRSGRTLDLRVGGHELGIATTADGTPCDPMGDDGEEVPKDCHHRLGPGASFTARMSFELREPDDEEEGWALDIQIGDNAAYDYTTIQRGGFYDYFQLEEELFLVPGQAFDGEERRPPIIQVTRSPGVETADPGVVISGVVEDPTGVRDVIIFHGKDKIFFRGGDAEMSVVPFTVDRTFEPGTNLVFILARNHRGLVSTWALDSWVPEGLAQTP